MKRALAGSALLLVAACSGGSDQPARDAAPARTTAAPPTTPAPGPSATASAPGARGPSPTSAPASAGASATRGTAEARTATAAPLPSSAGRPAPDRATRAGEYRYDTTGTVTAGTTRRVDGTARLLVDPPAGERQHAVLEGESGRTEQDLRLRANGRYLERLILTTPAFSKTFEPDAALLLPEPTRVGQTWSWSATSTDGATTVSQRSRVDRSDSVVLDGRRVPVVVVVTSLRLRGDVTYDGTTTTWVSPSHRLAVRVREQGSGTVGGVPFRSDTTSVLRSGKPA